MTNSIIRHGGIDAFCCSGDAISAGCAEIEQKVNGGIFVRLLGTGPNISVFVLNRRNRLISHDILLFLAKVETAPSEAPAVRVSAGALGPVEDNSRGMQVRDANRCTRIYS